MAIFKACQKLRCYLDRHQTTVFTDYKPLVNLQIQPHLSKRQAKWLEWLNKLALTIVYKPGSLQVVDSTLSHKPQTEQLHLPDSEASLASYWLSANAPQFSIEQCEDAIVDALRDSCIAQYLRCPYCSSVHLDSGQWATKAHLTHVCNACGQSWDHPGPQVQGNPLAMVGLCLHGNRLLFSRIAAVGGSAQSLTVEPSWLGLVYQGQQDAADAVMGRILAQARGPSAQFTIWVAHRLELVIGRPNLVFCKQLYLFLVVFIRCCYNICIIQYMLPISVYVKPLLNFTSMCGGLIQLSRFGNLWLVAQFANMLRMLISYGKVFYSPYLFLHRTFSNGLWISLQILLQFGVRMAYLCVC